MDGLKLEAGKSRGSKVLSSYLIISEGGCEEELTVMMVMMMKERPRVLLMVLWDRKRSLLVRTGCNHVRKTDEELLQIS